MARVVLLDAGPLGMVSNPSASPHNLQANLWLERLVASGSVVVIPEIADYEVRRELVRAGRLRGLATLDALKQSLAYLPLDTWTMLRAAQYWAQARQQGRPTAPDAALDCEVVLAAQAARCEAGEDSVVIATTNVGHLAMFGEARNWNEVLP